MARLIVASAVVASALTMIVAAQAPQPGTPGQTTQPGQLPTTPRMPPRVLRPGELPPKGTSRIRGQVTAGDTGAPIRRAQVRAMSFEGRGGGVTSTNNEGFFEIKDLPAGRYTIMATKGGYVTTQYGQRRAGEQGTPLELGEGQSADKVNFVMPRGSVIAGQITDDSGDPVSGTTVSAMRYMFVSGARRLVGAGSEGGTDRTDDQGMFRLYGLPPGDYLLSANNRINNFSSSPEITNTEADSYAPTYFPGTSNIVEAVRVSVRAGQQHTGANFSLIVTRLARVRGRALNSRGEPAARASVMMAPADTTVMSFGMGVSNAMIAADGAFQLLNVAPGRYNLTVRPMSGGSGPGEEFGSVPVTVGAEDIEDLMVSTSPGATARGTIVTDEGSAPEFRAEQIQISATPAEPFMTMPAGNSSARVNPDFSFEISSVFERRVIRAFVPPATGWYFKAVYHDGEDVTDNGIDFSSGKTVDGIQIVVTQKTTDLSGLVLDSRGRPALDATVIVFPANRERWARYVRTSRPDTEGRYRMRSLRPDEGYFIIAVQGLQDGQAGDPEFLARAREEAKAFSLAEGETKNVDVRLSAIQP